MSLYPFYDHPGFCFFYHPHLLDPPSRQSSFSVHNGLTRSVPDIHPSPPNPPSPYNHFYARYGYANHAGYVHGKSASENDFRNKGIKRSMSNYVSKMRQEPGREDTGRGSTMSDPCNRHVVFSERNSVYSNDTFSSSAGGTYVYRTYNGSLSDTWHWARRNSPSTLKVGDTVFKAWFPIWISMCVV